MKHSPTDSLTVPHSRTLVVARWALTLLALVPLLVDKGVLYPFITPKVLGIRVLVAVASVCVLVEMLRSPQLRADIVARIARLGRNPLALAVGAVVLTLVVSTAGAANRYHAFHGDVERGEGLVGMIALYGFFFLTAILFERRDWIRFFVLIIAAGVVLFGHAMFQWLGGMRRPGSLTGHAAYLGPYCLFMISAAVLVAAHVRSRRAKALALASIPVALGLLLVTETRAAILGLAVAAVAVLVLSAARGTGGGGAGDARARQVAIVLLGCLVVGTATLFATRRWPVWHPIPGVRRVVGYRADDVTTQWRLGTWQASLKAASPRASGWHRQFFGWGLDNFHVAFNKHYDPPPHRYDPEWYDRSHNVPIDILIMTGVFGLAAYLTMWGAFFVMALQRSRPPPEQAALLFAGVAYFVQNLVSFDSLPTYVPFFGLLAYTVATPTADSSSQLRLGATTRRVTTLAITLVGALALFSVWSLFAQTVPAYMQMRRYVSLYQMSSTSAMLAEWPNVRTPYTYAQPYIRASFLPTARILLRQNRGAEPLLVAAVDAMTEVTRRDTLDPRYMVALGEALDEYADAFGRPELHRTAEGHLRRALALAPGRRHVRHALLINRWRQGCPRNASTCYYELLGQMMIARNGDGATLVRERLELLDPARLQLLGVIKRLITESKFDSVRVSATGNDVTVTLNGQRRR